MYSSKNNKIIKIIMCFIVFFSFSTIINAEDKPRDNYQNKEQSNDLFKYCNTSNNCLPICIYKCREKSLYCDIANENNLGHYGYIGHYYNEAGTETETDGITDTWEIGVLPTIDSVVLRLAGKYANLYTWKNDKLMQADNFHYGEIGINQNGYVFPEPWKETKGYKNVNEHFICPKYMDSFSENFMSDQATDAPFLDVFTQELPVAFSDQDTGSIKVLEYSFIDEFENVLTAATSTSSFDYKEAYEFVEISIGYLEYNESQTEEQNNEKFCSFIKEKMGTDKTENISNLFSKNDQVIKLIINNKLKKSTTNTRVYEIYDYDKLNSLFEGQRIVDKSNRSYFKRLNEIYSSAEKNSLAYFNSKCNLGLTENQLEEIEAKTTEKVMEKLDSTTHKLENIDYDTKFDCNSLFSGEIAKIISGAYFIIEMVALALLIVLTVVGYMKVIMNGESDEIKKENQKLIKRLIILAVIFILPALINTTLKLFKIEGFDSDHPLCVNISNK
jgi:hypothetical protein